MKTCDVGSLPFAGDFKKFLNGVPQFLSSRCDDAIEYFQSEVIKGFLNKAQAGINVPCYPQFRDMNSMFLETFDGIEKIKQGYVESKVLSLKGEKKSIPEVMVIKESSREISEKLGRSFKFGICVTGPYTLSSLFVRRDSDVFLRLAHVISQLIENTIFNGKHGMVSLIAVDEPVFGFLDDPLIDFGSPGRENLRKAWEIVFSKAKFNSVQTSLHLHSTADQLFWQVKSLDIIDSEVDNSLYKSKKTKECLESYDKFLKANVCITDFHRLIEENVIKSFQQKPDEFTIGQIVAENWKKILNKEIDATTFLEDTALIKKRIADIANRYGKERVPYASPECGLKGYPTYECALECLRRVALAAKTVHA